MSFLIDMFISWLPDSRAYPLKRFLLRLKSYQVEQNVRVISSACFRLKNFTVGENTFIGHQVFISSGTDAHINIGKNVDIGPRCTIVAGTHDVGHVNHRAGRSHSKNIHIGDGVWLGAGCTVLAGVFIANGCVVAAGSVVTKDVPENSLVAGNPATVKKKLQ